MNFGTVIGRNLAHPVNFFWLDKISHNSKKNRFSAKFRNSISGKWAKVQLQNFFPNGPWASPYNERKNLAPTPENLAKMGFKFLGVEQFQLPGGNIVGDV